MKPLHTRVEAEQLDRAAAMLKVLSHPKRLAIVDLLGKSKSKPWISPRLLPHSTLSPSKTGAC
jgi:DNA-binding transcriptional ArsR family regulator